MIEVTLSWTVVRPKDTGGSLSLMAATDFILDDCDSVLGQAALEDSLLKQLAIHFSETVYSDVIKIVELTSDEVAHR